MSRAKAYLKENLIIIIAFALVSIIEITVIFPIMSENYLSYDSSYQYGLTQHSFSEISELLLYDYSPPFYSITLKLYCTIFGSSLFVMRTFSLFAIIGVYFISTFPMNTLFGKRSALICLLTTFAATNILSNTHEIRPINYAFFFIEAAAVYAGIAFSKGTKYSYICFTIFSVLAMYTHNVSLVSTFAVYAALLLLVLISKDRNKLKKVFISGCICAVTYLPWLGVIFSQISNVQKHYWVTPCTFSDVSDWLFYGYHNSYVSDIISDVIHLMIILIIIITLLRHIDFKKLKGAKSFKEVLRLPTEKSVYSKIAFLLLCFVLSVGIMELVSEFVYNIRSERYYSILAMIWLVVLSAVFGNIGNKACCAAFAVIMLANHAFNVMCLKQSLETANMTEIVEDVQNRSPDGNICFLHLHEYSLGIMSYYFPEATHYVCDETFTVTRTFDVFSYDVIDIGSIDNIWNYTDSFYMFKNKWVNFGLGKYLADELERMNDNEVTDIGSYAIPYRIFEEDFKLAEAVYTGEKTNR